MSPARGDDTFNAMRWLVLLVLVGPGCGEEVLAPAPPSLEPALDGTAPEEIGPYRIGVTTFQTSDGEPDGRPFAVEVWYPAQPAEGAPVASYQVKAADFVLTELDSPNGAVRDAALDVRGAAHPVIVFSHGNSGLRIQSVYMTEHLASHGFVVAAPDHEGNTFSNMSSTAAESARVRPVDVSRALDGLLARADGWPDEVLAFGADPARVGVAGHSFGGYTAFRVAGGTIDVEGGHSVCADDPGLLFCDGFPPDKPFPESAHDPRFIAALPQAPGAAAVFQGAGFQAIDVPVMIQAGTADVTTPFETEAQAPFDALHTTKYLLSIGEAGHFTFSDMCLLVAELGLTLEVFDDGCADANIPYGDAHRIINQYATAFFKVHVAGDESYPFHELLRGQARAPATLIGQ